MKRTDLFVLRFVAPLAVAVWSLAPARADLVKRYELIELNGESDGSTRAYALNDTGQVVGWAAVGSTRHSAHWHNRVTTDLHGIVHFQLLHFYVLFDQDYSESYAISNGGQLVGTARTQIDCPPTLLVTNAFIARPAVLTDLATPYAGDALTNLMTFANPCSGAYDSAAVGISNRNHVVGWADSGADANVPNRVTRAFLITPVGGQFVTRGLDGGNDLLVDLGTLAASDPVSAATAVNDAGQVTGYSYTIDADDTAAYHAFLVSPLDNDGDGIGDTWYVDGGSGVNLLMSDLGTLNGTNSWGRAITQDGRVVGESDVNLGTGQHYTHAFLYAGGQLSDLGTLHTDKTSGYSAASGINSSGTVVGWAENENRERHAFIFENGAMQDLNDLLYLLADDGSTIVPHITLSEARDVNADGVIVGWGDIKGSTSGETRGFLLNPVMVDPATLVQNQTNNNTGNTGTAAGTGITAIPGQADYTSAPVFGVPNHLLTTSQTDTNTDQTTTTAPVGLCGTGTLAALPLTLAGLAVLRRRRW